MNKVAGLCIRDKKLLVVHKIGEEVYFSLGGKIEQDETELQCLEREVWEEARCKVTNPKFLGFIITLILGKVCLKKSTLPSVEPSSTTITSSGLVAKTLGRFFSKSSLPFQFGITIEAFIVFYLDESYSTYQTTRL